MKKFVLTFLLLVSYISKGQNVYLDPSFGSGGTLVDTSISNIPINVYFENNNYFLINYSNSIVCLNYNGSKNLSFGTNGVKSFNSANDTFLVKGSKLLNGFIYIYGVIYYSNTDDDLFIVKISLNGELDLGFGQNGVLKQDFGTSDDILNDILFLQDGKIMGVGTKTETTSQLFVTRYNSNGIVDLSFDSNGYKIPPIDQSDRSFGANLFNFENNILVVGKSSYFNSGNHQDLRLIKMDENANYISNFGTNGVKKVPLTSLSDAGSYSVFNASLINGNDLYFVAYYGYSFSTQFNTLKKYNFVNNTISDISGIPYSYPFYVFDNAQKIYITGTERCSPTTSSNCPRNFNLYRKTTSGTTDISFNGNGSYSYNFFPTDFFSDDRSSTLYLHNDGKIFMAGNGYNPNSNGTGLEMLRLTDVQLSLLSNNIDKPSIVPNPIKEELTIENFEDKLITEIKIYDLLGNQVFISTENNKKINLSGLQQGIYFAKIKADSIDYFVKFIKS